MKIELNGGPHEGAATVAEAVAAATAPRHDSAGVAARETGPIDGPQAPPRMPTPGSADAAKTARGIAVAVNGEVVPRSEWDRPLADGDAVEVLTATQGG